MGHDMTCDMTPNMKHDMKKDMTKDMTYDMTQYNYRSMLIITEAQAEQNPKLE